MCGGGGGGGSKSDIGETCLPLPPLKEPQKSPSEKCESLISEKRLILT